ncbi:MAG: hypothetical protein CUN55_00090 [Phototrophicales bacterium]|nr:MAG: hypothetical protein CUN55_00090 [Phototrophicales bacterium]
MELAIFLLVGSVAIFAAVMMLISENPVHSALFLILNFACVAFLYLMLDAEFLALVQITVYAGAIMVLFLFVIMLLGADRLLPKPMPRYNWLTPAAVGIVATLLFVASIAIVESQLNDFEPHHNESLLRVVQSDSDFVLVDVYLDDQLIAEELSFGETSPFEEVPVGEHQITVYQHEDDPSTASPLIEEVFFVEEDNATTLIVLPAPIDGSYLLPVATDLTATEEYGTARLTIVHAADCPQTCIFDIADVTDAAKPPRLFAEELTYGTVTTAETLYRDRYVDQEFEVAAYQAGAIASARAGEEDTSRDIPPLLHHPPFEVKSNHNILWVVTSDTRAQDVFRLHGIFEDVPNRPSFGGAKAIGESLYVDYMLAFQIVGLLLLTAMIGVIVLTKEGEIIPRRRQVRRMAAIPGAPTVEEYLAARESGQRLPPPSGAKQLPESTGD